MLYGKKLLVMLMIFVSGVGMALSQERQGNVSVSEVEPITCWWRADRSAVRAGEAFQVFLTCRVADANSATVVINDSNLDPRAVSLPPFNITGGERYKDLKRGNFKFYRYRYGVRFSESGYFGQDIEVIPLEVRYHVEMTNLQSGLDKSTTRERIYKLPKFKILIHSLVESETKDIRDSSDNLLGNSENFRFRARIFFIAAWFISFIAVTFVLHFLISAVRNRNKKKVESGIPTFGNFVLLGRMIRQLRSIRRESKKRGWSQELATQTMSVLRIVGAITISGKVSQVLSDSDHFASGQLKLRQFPFSKKAILVSSGTTLETLRDYFQTTNESDKNKRFISVFETFSRARHGFGEKEKPDSNLEASINLAIEFTRKLRFNETWLVKKVRSITSLVSRT